MFPLGPVTPPGSTAFIAELPINLKPDQFSQLAALNPIRQSKNGRNLNVKAPTFVTRWQVSTIGS